jgi:NADPH:quinone reductase-like Zn-dependent oxidoreductase/acyl carrier protein
LRPAERRQPGPGEVEIRVRATGLNFRDVLNVLGLYPGDAGPLGGECAGEVVAIGEGVSRLAVGDPVVALAPGCFSSYATTLAALAVPIPQHLGFEEAATIPIAFLTADYALRRLGRMRAGDRILIHAASGGVGLAAVQLAQMAGAEIFATAGNPEKRRYLESLGVPHVMDSRSLEFADQIRQATQSRGVDLVLNSLAGESIAQSISVLAPGGRFLEIGKTDLWDQDRVAALNPGASFYAIALDQMTADDPQAVGTSLRRLMEEFAAKRLQPLPRRVFPIGKAADAFRYMARARHIGKIVVTAPDVGWDKAPSGTGVSPVDRGVDGQDARATRASQPTQLREDATYLITGGLGGLGLKVAEWMADRGARHLVLVGRSGASQRAQPVLKRLQDAGVQVVVARADAARRDDLAKLLLELEAGMPPLRGVVHAAGVLDDGVLTEQTRRRFDAVMAAKVAGAWNLHVLCEGRPLDFFVLFSSAAALFGSPGQGNYAAANAFLDALAHHRQWAGRPALAVNWGSWSEVGMAAASRDVAGRHWEELGMGWIDPPRGLRTLGRLLRSDAAQAAVLPVDWSKFFARVPVAAAPPFLAEMGSQTESGASVSGESSEFLSRLQEAEPGERQEVLLAEIRRQVALVLGNDPSNLPDPYRPLHELGFDSLAAVELCNALGRSLGKHLPPTMLFDYSTLDALSTHLIADVLRFGPGEEGDASESAARHWRDASATVPPGEEAAADKPPLAAEEGDFRAEALAQVEGLSDENMESLIAEEIAKLHQQ